MTIDFQGLYEVRRMAKMVIDKLKFFVGMKIVVRVSMKFYLMMILGW